MRIGVILMACVMACAAAMSATAQQSDSVLRVCADPDNLPLSHRSGEGYENKIAEALAGDFGRRIEYTYFPQRMGFVRNTLRKKDAAGRQFLCDVIIGVPKGYELTATTRPYMHSTYALLVPVREAFAALKKADDLLQLSPGKLASLRIGVFARSPGTDWLLRNNLLEHAVVYAAQSGDPAENPAHTIERELAAGNIDVAILWGPIAGFLVQRHAASPAWRAVPFLPDAQIRFNYEISMGVRFGEKQWQGELDAWISSHQAQINEILARFHIPLLDAGGNLIQGVMPDGASRSSIGGERIQHSPTF